MNGMRRRNRLLPLVTAAAPLGHLPLSEITLRAGQHLHRAGMRIEAVYFPHDAVISMNVPLHDGEGIEAGMIGHEGVIGGAAAFGIGEALHDATVQIAGTATRLSVDEFRKATNRSETLRRALARQLTMLLLQVQQTAACNAVHTVEARLCRWLLDIRDRVQGDTLPITQFCLAGMLGVQRTTVSLVGKSLQQSGAYRCRRGHIHVLDAAELERHACECYRHLRRRAERLSEFGDELPLVESPLAPPLGLSRTLAS
jgi:CRP-like cAMP-binding protein